MTNELPPIHGYKTFGSKTDAIFRLVNESSMVKGWPIGYNLRVFHPSILFTLYDENLRRYFMKSVTEKARRNVRVHKKRGSCGDVLLIYFPEG